MTDTLMPILQADLVIWPEAEEQLVFDPIRARIHRMNPALCYTFSNCATGVAAPSVVEGLIERGLLRAEARAVVVSGLALLSRAGLLTDDRHWPWLRIGLPPAWVPEMRSRSLAPDSP